MDRHARAVMVFSAACQPYGTTSFWPVVELLSSGLGGGRKLDRAALQALALEAAPQEREAIIGRVASVLGLIAASFPLEECVWATARLFASMASQQPLIIVVEDLHWAEEALLDLLDNLRLYPHPPGTLILATARPELLDMGHFDDDSSRMQIVRLPALSAGRATSSWMAS